MFRLSKTTNPLNIDGDSFSADGGRVIVKLRQATYGPGNMDWASLEGGGLFADCGLVRLELSIDDDSTLCLKVINASKDNIRVEDVIIEFAASAFKSPCFAREHQHLVHTGALSPLAGVKPVHLPVDWSEVDRQSGMVTVYSHNQTRQALLIGALPPFGGGYAVISTLHDSPHMEGAFGFKVRFDFRQTLAPGASLVTSPLVVLQGKSGEVLLEQYAKLLRSRITRPKKQVAVGWNSWDYYAGAITRKDMDENIDVCKRNFGDRIKYIVIDEGWECMWGVWQPNWKFPEGLTSYCQKVKEAGYIPGIWTAPLMVCVYTPLYRNHPDWFVSDADGNVHLRTLAYGSMAQLDITHGEVQDHLRSVYTTLRGNGFEYFKCDFAHMVLEAEQFHDPSVGRADIIRMLFQLIRESIGDDSYLLSCGPPFESVIGIADAFRTGGDVHNYWGHIIQTCRTFLARWWMQGSIGNVDPDFAIVRCGETTDDPQLSRRNPVKPRNLGSHWTNGAQMNLEEAKVLAMAVYMTGGDIFLSDAIDKLNEAGIDVLKKIMPPLPAPAKPLNLFSRDGMSLPILIAETNDEFIVAAFNLTDDPQTQTINPDFVKTPTDALDFWTNEPVRIDQPLQILLSPRSAKALKFKK